MAERPTTFRQFWPVYLAAHRNPMTRRLHYLATVCGIGSVILSLVTLNLLFIAFGIPVAYALALGSHKWVEGRPSLMGVNAVHGARADLLMCWKAVTGALPGEFARFGIREDVVGRSMRGSSRA